ncbi:hypothetical protein BGZ65_005854 [Modicella reniformis]|uniref:NAD-dependent epimerase/dehydratase domain-containing protein n=1 Tax=Modicella reniformis TaxID=1440133 RepID=A0A9P6SSX5_9FUNG|nr:hypothetical protein BGZ65_005854 [Modicella reniformis]
MMATTKRDHSSQSHWKRFTLIHTALHGYALLTRLYLDCLSRFLESKQAVVGLVQKRFSHDLVVSPKTGRIIIRQGAGGRSSTNGHVVTVFGCTGFLGRYLVNRLARDGAHVIVPYRDEDDMRHLKVMGDLGKIIPMEIHLRNKDSLEAAVRHADTVYNLLGRDYETKNFSFADVHVEAAGVLAELAQKHDVDRFIQVSALNARIDSPSRFLSTKAEGEVLVRSIFPSTTIVRPSLMYGQEDRFLSRLAMSRGLSVRINGGNTKVRPVNVSDVAGAMFKMLDGANTVGETYELVGNKEYTYKELLDFIKDITNLDIGDVNVPKPIASLMAKVLNVLPWQTLGADEIERMMIDDKLTGAKTFEDLGVEPTLLEITGIQYLRRFRTNLYNDEPLKKGVVGKKKIFHTSYLAPAGSAAGSSGGSGSGNTLAFDPRELTVDQSKFRVGGFAGQPNTIHSSQSGDVDSNESSMNDQPQSSEQDEAREKRQERFMGLLHSGALGTPKIEHQRPGTVFTLPVVKPKLM